ncbi:hypothetical protein V498_03456 [Pseudogymnoascus sp. VKM F-4517 (FW-2822)]|nr:hypothetical protein V498_03456 [Pseudogymnoascus sp. VKM F-4517 (FW-2822)]
MFPHVCATLPCGTYAPPQPTASFVVRLSPSIYFLPPAPLTSSKLRALFTRRAASIPPRRRPRPLVESLEEQGPAPLTSSKLRALFTRRATSIPPRRRPRPLVESLEEQGA